MANDYIKIVTSDNTSYKFKVLLEGYDPSLKRAQNAEITLDGTTDFTIGSVKRRWVFNIRARAIPRETGFGSMDDLEYLYSINDPGGTVKTMFQMTDHYGDEYSVFILGDFHRRNLGVMLEGQEASFVAQVVFQER